MDLLSKVSVLGQVSFYEAIAFFCFEILCHQLPCKHFIVVDNLVVRAT
jgi:hypothetical protein